jgi:phosphoribosyl-AMP cyclohydrolase
MNDSNGPAFADDSSLLPAIAQDHATGRVLMLAYMNRAAYAETLRTGQAVYYSRSRQRLWRKGETSGHVQRVVQVLVDCDRDTILLRVEQVGPGCCHEGYASCFFREAAEGELRVIEPPTFDAGVTYAD